MVKIRERVTGFQVECPHCHGDGEHHGPIPWPNCIRCGGYGTIVLIDPSGHGKEAGSDEE